MNFHFANLVQAVQPTATKLCLGSKMLRMTCSGNYSSTSMNLASDWLKPESSPMEEEKTEKQHMADGVNVFSLLLQRKWPRLWTCGRVSVICGTQQIKTDK